jgi:hypothetical protein
VFEKYSCVPLDILLGDRKKTVSCCLLRLIIFKIPDKKSFFKKNILSGCRLEGARFYIFLTFWGGCGILSTLFIHSPEPVGSAVVSVVLLRPWEFGVLYESFGYEKGPDRYD